MAYRLNRLDEPDVFMAVPKPMLTVFGIHYILREYIERVLPYFVE